MSRGNSPGAPNTPRSTQPHGGLRGWHWPGMPGESCSVILLRKARCRKKRVILICAISDSHKLLGIFPEEMVQQKQKLHGDKIQLCIIHFKMGGGSMSSKRQSVNLIE